MSLLGDHPVVISVWHLLFYFRIYYIFFDCTLCYYVGRSVGQFRRQGESDKIMIEAKDWEFRFRQKAILIWKFGSMVSDKRVLYLVQCLGHKMKDYLKIVDCLVLYIETLECLIKRDCSNSYSISRYFFSFIFMILYNT